MIGPDLGRK
ncbi:unnamed protein product, partial [Didymodactylos carnosus]